LEPDVDKSVQAKMLHHVSLGTADLARARVFYDAVMQELGLKRTFESDEAVGYGAGITVFSLNLPADGAPASPGNGVHVAFEVEKRSAVDAFFRAALENGGKADGEPGLRPEYDDNYYAAFVRDPDGNKIEALTFVAG
jgi:catechol 2,3-dioxygenase-like lactoylglutathione lyase family enzyme